MKVVVTTLTLLLLLGCQTTNQDDVQKNARILESIFEEGTVYSIKVRPPLRPYFESVHESLSMALDADVLTTERLLKFLDRLGIKEITTPNGRLVIGAARLLLITSLSQINIDEVRKQALYVYANAIRDGIFNGLNERFTSSFVPKDHVVVVFTN
jgi:hypothetical protein